MISTIPPAASLARKSRSGLITARLASAIRNPLSSPVPIEWRAPRKPPKERRMATLIRPSHNPIIQWWRDHVVASVEHVRVVEKVHEESGWSPRYLFMTLVSAGIAVLGLLLSSPAVVIGAMLISPLMGPIIGLGFGIATFDSAEIRRSGVALGGGTMVAILFCALVVMLSPLQNVTSEIAA